MPPSILELTGLRKKPDSLTNKPPARSISMKPRACSLAISMVDMKAALSGGHASAAMRCSQLNPLSVVSRFGITRHAGRRRIRDGE